MASILFSGEKMMEKLTVSHSKQIAGRAGRFNTQYEKGYVTTLEAKDLDYLREMLRSDIESITQVGFWHSFLSLQNGLLILFIFL